MLRLVANRFSDVGSLADKVTDSAEKRGRPLTHDTAVYVDQNLFKVWTVRAEALISDVCGPDSQHARHFASASIPKTFATNFGTFNSMYSVFVAARADFEGGYLVSTAALAQAEVFSDELEQARELLDKGYKMPAAVIAGVVLETALRKLCDASSLPNSKLDRMNADLAKAGLYNLLQQKQITALAQIRNDAAHGNSDSFSEANVSSMIDDVGRFLAERLG